MSTLAFNGAKDYKGHKLCRQCWDGITRKGKHACGQGQCQCPCRLMEKEAPTRTKKADLSLIMDLPGGTITV